MSRTRGLLVLLLVVVLGAGLLTMPIIRDAGDNGDNVSTDFEGEDCVDQEEALSEAEMAFAEAEGRLIVLDEQFFADPNDQDVVQDRIQAEAELARKGADVAQARRALSQCRTALSTVCAQAQDQLVTLTTEKAEVMEARVTLEGEIRELSATIRNPDQNDDPASLRGTRSEKESELRRIAARVEVIDEQLPELERQSAICGPTGRTPEEQPDDHGTGDSVAQDLWGLTCGTANPEAVVSYYRYHPEQTGNKFGPAADVLELTDPSPEEAVIEMNWRRCFDPALVVAHLVSAGDHNVAGFEDWAGLSQERMLWATKQFAGNSEVWALGIVAMRSVEDTLTTRFETKQGDLNESMYMQAGEGVPLITRNDVGVPNFVALQYVNDQGQVILEYKLDCGFQPSWPKDTPPPSTPTTVPPPGSTTPPPTTTVPPPPGKKRVCVLSTGEIVTIPVTEYDPSKHGPVDDPACGNTPPPTTTVPPPPTTGPPPTTTPPEEPKCFDEDGNPVYEEEYCGTPGSGPEQQPVDDNDPEHVAPTPNAPIVAPPPPPAEDPTEEEEEAVADPEETEISDEEAPAPTDVCPGVPGQQTEGPCEQPTQPSVPSPDPVDWCPHVPGVQPEGTLCPPPPPGP